MTRIVILRPRAEQDIKTAYQWYESQQTGLGEEFLASLRQKLDSIHIFPESAEIIHKRIRRAIVPRFPYLLFYLIEQDRIAVLAVFHTSRNPAKWPKAKE